MKAHPHLTLVRTPAQGPASAEQVGTDLGGDQGTAEMLDQYVTWCRASGMRPATIRLRVHWLTRIGRAIDLRTATPANLIAWLGAGNWQPETRKSARASLRSFYQWAVVSGMVDSNPAAHLPAVRVPPSTPKPTPTEVLQAALERASDRDRLLLGLAGFAGLRRSEVASLTWTSISGGHLRFGGKGGRTRTVPLLPALEAELRAEASRRDRGIVGSGYRFEVDPGSPFVFPGRLGGHMSPDSVGAVLSRLLGDGWTGHTLRHRFATLAYGVERDLLTVQNLLGHSKPETTARYAAPPPGAAAAAVRGAAA